MKRDLLVERIESGLSVPEIAHEHGVSRQCVDQWIAMHGLRDLYARATKLSRRKICSHCGHSFYDTSRGNVLRGCTETCRTALARKYKRDYEHRLFGRMPRQVRNAAARARNYSALRAHAAAGTSINAIVKDTGIPIGSVNFKLKNAGLYELWKTNRERRKHDS